MAQTSSNSKKFLLILVGLIVISVALLFLWARSENNVIGGLTSSKMTDGDLNVQISSEKSSYKYGDIVKLSYSVENISGSTKKYTFSSTCQDGSVEFDGKPANLMQLCGQAITDVELPSGHVENYGFEARLVKDFEPVEVDGLGVYDPPDDSDYVAWEGQLRLNPGEHKVRVNWQDVQSSEITIKITE